MALAESPDRAAETKVFPDLLIGEEIRAVNDEGCFAGGPNDVRWVQGEIVPMADCEDDYICSFQALSKVLVDGCFFQLRPRFDQWIVDGDYSPRFYKAFPQSCGWGMAGVANILQI